MLRYATQRGVRGGRDYCCGTPSPSTPKYNGDHFHVTSWQTLINVNVSLGLDLCPLKYKPLSPKYKSEMFCFNILNLK
jgi:hypothetical protein